MLLSQKMLPGTMLPSALLGISLGWPAVQAAEYAMPREGNNLVGEIQFVEARSEDTLLDIARRYDLGFNEITAANPDIDPWLPRQGARVVLPTRFVLPQPPWKGIVMNLSEMRLYYFPESENGEPKRVVTHPIGIGRQGWATPVGSYQIIVKIENPNWTMPDAAYKKALANGYQPRRLVPPGPANPLGKFAMMLNADGLFIHGTNRPFSIGMRVSYGCLRLYPEDISHLIPIVAKGTMVRIEEEPYKFGRENGVLFLEAHAPLKQGMKKTGLNLTPVVSGVVKAKVGRLSAYQWDHVIALASNHNGMPTPILQPLPKHASTQ